MTDTPLTLSVTPSTYSLTCPACRDNLLSEEVSSCDACKVPHHAACLTEIGCASLNCNPGGTREHRALAGSPNPLAELVAEGLHVHRWEEDGSEGRLGTITAGRCHREGGDHGRDATLGANWGVLASEFGGTCCSLANLPGGCCCNPETSPTTPGCAFWGSGRFAEFEVLETPCQCEARADERDEDNEWPCETLAAEHLTSLEEDHCPGDDEYQWTDHFAEEDWDENGREEWAAALAMAIGGKLELSCEDYPSLTNLGDALLDRLAWKVRRESEHYPEWDGYSTSFPTDEWADEFVEDASALAHLLPHVEWSSGDYNGHPLELDPPSHYLYALATPLAEAALTAARHNLTSELAGRTLMAVCWSRWDKFAKTPDRKRERVQAYRACLAMAPFAIEFAEGMLSLGDEFDKGSHLSFRYNPSCSGAWQDYVSDSANALGLLPRSAPFLPTTN